MNTAVSAALRASLRPGLRAAGFTEFSGRRAWARHGPAVWCLSMPSFNAHVAHGVGCTTMSFGVNLGVHFHTAVTEPATGTGRPSEAECIFRFTGHATIRQPFFHPYGRTTPTDRSDVWFVQPDGSNLAEVIDDACTVILGPGVQQLAACTAPSDALARLHSRSTTVSPSITEFDVAPHGSPRWAERVALVEALCS